MSHTIWYLNTRYHGKHHFVPTRLQLCRVGFLSKFIYIQSTLGIANSLILASFDLHDAVANKVAPLVKIYRLIGNILDNPQAGLVSETAYIEKAYQRLPSVSLEDPAKFNNYNYGLVKRNISGYKKRK